MNRTINNLSPAVSPLSSWLFPVQQPTPALNDINGIPDPTKEAKAITLIIAKTVMSLDQVSNTSDANKPVSNATASALSGKSDTGHVHPDLVNVSSLGVANGVATLDAGGKILSTQLPLSVMSYLGTWNAATNSPSLTDGAGNTGDVYRISIAGSRDFGSGIISFESGDYVIYNGSVWEKADGTDAVTSVNGQQGVVLLSTSDISEGANLYYTDTRVQTFSDLRYSLLSHTHTFASLTSKPTTISGYGITDAFTQATADTLYSSISHTHTFASLTAKPTTISGYGITDAFTQAAADALYSVLGHTHTFASLTAKPTTLSGYGITDAVNVSVLGIANGVATLDNSGLVPSSQLPSYVDDVLEFANLAAFPATGTTGKIYVAIDANETYRWSGTVYIRIANGAVQSVNTLTGNVTLTTTNITEGINLYYTDARVQTFGDSRYSLTSHTHTFASLTSKPTTISDYGITDAFTQATADTLYAAINHTHTFASLTSKPTTLAGYGITDAEPFLGNPSTNGYVLSSTAAGVRSWVAPASGGGSSQWTGTTDISHTGQVAAIGNYTVGTSIPTTGAGKPELISAGRFNLVNNNRTFYVDINTVPFPYAEFASYKYDDGTTFPLVFQGNGGNTGFGYTGVAPASLVSVAGGVSIGNSVYSTAAPANGLLVQGGVNINSLGTGTVYSNAGVLTNTNPNPSSGSQWTTSGSDIYYNTGKVGIGTGSTIDAPLHIKYSDVDGIGIKVENLSATGTFKNFNISQMGSTAYGISDWVNTGVIEGQSSGGMLFGAVSGDIKFTSGGRLRRATILSTGEFLIGNQTSSNGSGAKLQVNGDVSISTLGTGTVYSNAGTLTNTNPFVQWVDQTGAISYANKVYIGATTDDGSGAKLQVAGAINLAGTLSGFSAKVNTQIIAATYTILSTDNGCTLRFSVACTVTVPTGLPAGFNCILIQEGAGQITLAASGTTINNPDSYTKSAKQYAPITLVQYTTNVFLSGGYMAA